AGESGAGKSEIAASIAEKLAESGYNSLIFGQDDYFRLPPKTNAKQRENDISWVGPDEVRLDLLDRNIKDILEGREKIRKPLVDFNADMIGEEEIETTGYKIIIAEGTYTTLLEHADCRVFIDRNRWDTRDARQKRNRERQDAFLEKILSIEHEIISKHKQKADIVISRNFNASLNH
ncbi:MAG: uridine kinase family protein, partial [Bacteroidales bacterium]